MSDCNHTVAESCLQGDECAQCLREADKRGPTMKASEITFATRFDEEGHSEPWRNELAGELNELVSLVDFQLDPHKQPAKAVFSIVARVAEFEEIKSA